MHGATRGRQTAQSDINERVDNLVGGREVEPQQSAFDAIEQSGYDGTVKTMTPMEYAHSFPDPNATSSRHRYKTVKLLL